MCKAIKILSVTFLLNIFCMQNSMAAGRYSSDEKPLPNELPKSDTAEVVCKCDPTNDPCCIPPLGTSSNKTTKPNLPTSDVSTCKCDLKKDPCCKPIAGTKKEK